MDDERERDDDERERDDARDPGKPTVDEPTKPALQPDEDERTVEP